MTLIYSLNYLVASLGQIMEVLGMNAHSLLHLYRTSFAAQFFTDPSVRACLF